MNKLFIIGNVTRDPEMRTTQNGIPVCSFNVAVNRRMGSNAENAETDFFRVTAWRGLGENCHRYLAKGKKVSVVGSVSASAYIGNDGQARANMEINAEEVEFLSPKADPDEAAYMQQEREAIQNEAAPAKKNSGFVEVDDEELPF